MKDKIAEKIYASEEPLSMADNAIRYQLMIAVNQIPERKNVEPRVDFCPVDYGPGVHQKGVDWCDGGYGYLYAELCMEHDAKKEKVRNRRRADRKHPENKAERKKEQQNRLHRLYGLAYEDGYGYIWNKKEGQKKFPEYEAEIFRNLKERSAEKDAICDYMTELRERKVGYNAAERIMYNADKHMREIRAKVADPEGKCDDTFVVTYDDSYVVIDPDGERQHCYPDDYYWWKATFESYEYMIRKYGMEYANKYAKGEIY